MTTFSLMYDCNKRESKSRRVGEEGIINTYKKKLCELNRLCVLSAVIRLRPPHKHGGGERGMWFTTTATEVTIYLNTQKYSHVCVQVHTITQSHTPYQTPTQLHNTHRPTCFLKHVYSLSHKNTCD